LGSGQNLVEKSGTKFSAKSGTIQLTPAILAAHARRIGSSYQAGPIKRHARKKFCKMLDTVHGYPPKIVSRATAPQKNEGI